MKEMTTYLTFDGNCAAAVKFYAKCLGADLHVMTFADAKMDTPPAAKDKVMHARLQKGPAVLMASDSMPGTPVRQGDNFSICISPESKAETEQLFKALGEKGKVTMPLADTFWGAYFGMLTDQFGINWMLNFHNPEAKK